MGLGVIYYKRFMKVRNVEHPHLLLWTKGSGKCIVIWASVNQHGPTSDYYLLLLFIQFF